MHRKYKFLLRPTAKQQDALNGALRLHCEIYNAALEHRREAWKHGVRVSFVSQSHEWVEVRSLRPDAGALNSTSVQQTLRRLDKAFQAFFRRVKAGQKPGYPRFKSAARWASIDFVMQAPFDGGLRDGRIRVPGIGSVRCHQHRPIPDGARVKQVTVKQVTVKREGRRWYAVLSCDDVPAKPLPQTGAVVGVDLGVASFLTTSDGKHVPNERHLAASAVRLATAQQALSRCKRGSARRRAVRARVAAIHGKVRRQRLDHAHKTALALVRDCDFIAHEALNVAGMTKAPAARPDGEGGYLPNGAAAKAGLNRSILDAGWGVFLDVLRAKAESAGRVVVEVNPRNTSRRCAACGHTAAGNRVTQAAFCCVSCGHTDHADVNAAINILRAGLALRDVATAA